MHYVVTYAASCRTKAVELIPAALPAILAHTFFSSGLSSWQVCIRVLTAR